jgi:hypothetical protein
MKASKKLTLSLVVAGSALAPLAHAGGSGSLSITPAIIERVAATGPAGTVTVRNTTSTSLKITARVRPWTQSRSGSVRPDRRRTLSRWVRLSRKSFKLPPGAQREIDLRLLGVPASGSLYGNVEIVGMPPKGEQRDGIVAAYRLVSSLRLNPTPSDRKLSLAIGRAAVKGSGSSRSVVAAVRNGGNTVMPVGGTVRVKGARGVRSGTIAAQRILPGTIVDLRLSRAAGLPPGRYTVTVKLTQAGRSIARATRRVRVR